MLRAPDAFLVGGAFSSSSTFNSLNACVCERWRPGAWGRYLLSANGSAEVRPSLQGREVSYLGLSAKHIIKLSLY